MDSQLRVFDVIMKAEHGTTYNSYLVKGSSKTALIETAKEKFRDEYIAGLSTLVDPAEIDYIVLNHMEPDHTGSINAIMDLAVSARVVTSRNAVPLLKGIMNRDLDVMVVGDGDSIDLGGATLEFFQAPFLHWPETMFTFLREQGVLFPCDFLGSHYADERLFDDKLDDFEFAFRYYFDHIFRPFKEYVLKALDKIEDLPIQMVAPSHGPILRTDLHKYIEKYRQWASVPEKGDKTKVLVFYTSAYGNTALMAEKVAEGARDQDAEVGIFDLQAADYPSLVDEVEKADAIAVGSLTINGDAVKPVWDLLSSLATLKLRGKAAAAFGSYGWSGEAVKLLEDRLRGLKFKLSSEGVRAHLVPTSEDLEACVELGRNLAAGVKSAG
jgi:flavorubredoxin